MKKNMLITICDNCDKPLYKEEESKNVISVKEKDFCSIDCLIDWVTKPHVRKCSRCGGSGYTYRDAGYGDSDEVCTACKNGTEPVPSHAIFDEKVK